jgi:hypothetical protein
MPAIQNVDAKNWFNIGCIVYEIKPGDLRQTPFRFEATIDRTSGVPKITHVWGPSVTGTAN